MHPLGAASGQSHGAATQTEIQAKGKVVEMVARKPRKPKRVPVPLNVHSTGHLRQLLTARLVASEPWAVAVIRLIDEGGVDLFVDDKGNLRANFTKVEHQLRRVGCYPPGGIMTLMHHCPRCGHWTPAGYVEKGIEDQCEECVVSESPEWLWSQWPASPSSHAIQQAKILGVRFRW